MLQPDQRRPVRFWSTSTAAPSSSPRSPNGTGGATGKGTVLKKLDEHRSAGERFARRCRIIDTPESSRKISDKEIVWLDGLKAERLVESRFNSIFFFSGASREPELAGVWGAIVGSFLTMLVTLALSLPDRRRGGDLSGGVRAEEPLDRTHRGQHQQSGRGAVDRVRPARPGGVPELLRPAAFGAAGRRHGACR